MLGKLHGLSEEKRSILTTSTNTGFPTEERRSIKIKTYPKLFKLLLLGIHQYNKLKKN